MMPVRRSLKTIVSFRGVGRSRFARPFPARLRAPKGAVRPLDGASRGKARAVALRRRRHSGPLWASACGRPRPGPGSRATGFRRRGRRVRPCGSVQAPRGRGLHGTGPSDPGHRRPRGRVPRPRGKRPPAPRPSSASDSRYTGPDALSAPRAGNEAVGTPAQSSKDGALAPSRRSAGERPPCAGREGRSDPRAPRTRARGSPAALNPREGRASSTPESHAACPGTGGRQRRLAPWQQDRGSRSRFRRKFRPVARP